jgi:orotate phosphoribosyltransferase
MQDYQQEFIQFALDNGVLCFGDFTLKSGRESPYFFNSGLFSSGASLARLGQFYASAIEAANIEYDMLFGPAYKGIPITISVAIALADQSGLDLPYCFNRKEVKGHGEGGTTLGASLKGKVLIIDDVISAGTSVNLSIDIINQSGAIPAGVFVALDRQERGTRQYSAIQEVEQQHNIKVISIITLENMIEYLENTPNMDEHLEKITHYRKQYGI